LVFPSQQTLIEEVLPCMMVWTLEEFVLFYVNATIFGTITILDEQRCAWYFCPCDYFLTCDWEPKHVTIGLFEVKGTIGINLANEL
jgi:hypothetical protein